MERVQPIQTELEYKPINKDRLAQELGGFSCDNLIECPIKKCFTDLDHIVQANPSMGVPPLSPLEKILKRQSYMHIPEICRFKHQQIDATWARSEPQTDEQVLELLKHPNTQLTRREREIITKVQKGMKRGKL